MFTTCCKPLTRVDAISDCMDYFAYKFAKQRQETIKESNGSRRCGGYEQERNLYLPLEELPNLPGKCDAIPYYDVEHGISDKTQSLTAQLISRIYHTYFVTHL